MVTDTKKMLKHFDESVKELLVFFRTHQSLTESQQFFIENRLMILQIEYNAWARDKLANNRDTAGTKKKTPSTVQSSDLSATQPSGSEPQST